MFPKAKYEIGFFTTISTSTTSYTDYIGDGTQCTHCTVVNWGKYYNIHSQKEFLNKSYHYILLTTSLINHLNHQALHNKICTRCSRKKNWALAIVIRLINNKLRFSFFLRVSRNNSYLPLLIFSLLTPCRFIQKNICQT